MTRYIHTSLLGIHGNSAFTLAGIRYPRSWWRTVGPDEIAALGFVEYTPPEPEPPSPEQAIEAFRNAIQSHVDATAIAKLYDSGNSLATYKDSTVPQWAAEAAAFIAWRDAVWAYSYAELDKVLSEEREQPTIEEFLDELPEMEWPE